MSTLGGTLASALIARKGSRVAHFLLQTAGTLMALNACAATIVYH